jgi:hypothetical protein
MHYPGVLCSGLYTFISHAITFPLLAVSIPQHNSLPAHSPLFIYYYFFLFIYFIYLFYPTDQTGGQVPGHLLRGEDHIKLQVQQTIARASAAIESRHAPAEPSWAFTISRILVTSSASQDYAAARARCHGRPLRAATSSSAQGEKCTVSAAHPRLDFSTLPRKHTAGSFKRSNSENLRLESFTNTQTLVKGCTKNHINEYVRMAEPSDYS